MYITITDKKDAINFIFYRHTGQTEGVRGDHACGQARREGVFLRVGVHGPDVSAKIYIEVHLSILFNITTA